jgi:hypothetical protein
MIYRGPGEKQTLDPLHLDCENDHSLCRKIAKLTIGQSSGQFFCLISRVELRVLLGIDISLTGNAKLGRAVIHVVHRLTVNRLNDVFAGRTCYQKTWP